MNNFIDHSFRKIGRVFLMVGLAAALSLGLGQATFVHASPAAMALQSTTRVFKSQPALDGWLLESSENSSVGGTLDRTSDSIRLGDNAANEQYRAILSFNTAALPDTAVITSLTLTLSLAGLTGLEDPTNTWGGLHVDMHKSFFGSSASLQKSDFQAASDHLAATDFSYVGSSYVLTLNSGSYPFVNRRGLTQFRLRFKQDDNNDHLDDYISFFSGNVTGVNSGDPVLTVIYHVP